MKSPQAEALPICSSRQRSLRGRQGVRRVEYTAPVFYPPGRGREFPVVQRLGNWKTRKMVSRYAHLADETLRSGAAKLADILDQDSGSTDDLKEPAAEYRTG